MKKKTKLILTSAATIAMSASLIAGGTFALFTDKASVNVALQAGDVDIEATVVQKSLETFSIAWNDSKGDYESLPTAELGVFTNGGTATFNDDYSELKLDLMSPGDSVKFTIDVENKSNISIQYRVVMEATGDLADALKATATIEGKDYVVDGVETKATLWQGAVGGQEIEDIDVFIDFPNADDNNLYKNASANVTYSIEAVQGNGHVVDHVVDTASKLQDAFEAGGTIEAPGLKVAHTTLFEMKGNDVTLGEINLSGENLMGAFVDGKDSIIQKYRGETLTLASGAALNVTDIGNQVYGIVQAYAGDIVLEEGSKITVDGAESTGIYFLGMGSPTRLFLNGSNLIEVSNGATGILFGTSSDEYQVYVQSYADYVYYKSISDDYSDGTAKNVKWYINYDLVEEGEAVVTTGDSVANALASGATTVTVNGNVTQNGSFANGADELTFVGTGAESSSISIPAIGNNLPTSAAGMDVSYKNITVVKDNSVYNGVQAKTETYTDCVIEGQLFLYADEVVFTNCTFEQTSADAYNVWTYAAKKVTFNNCTFNSAGKSILVYNEGHNGSEVTFNKCVLNASAPVEGKAAVEIDSSLLKDGMEYIVTFNETTENGFAVGSMSNETLYNEKKGDKATVYVDGYEVIVYGLNKQVANGEYYITNENGLVACGETYFAQGGTFNFTKNLDMDGVAYNVPDITNVLTINGNNYAISNLTIVGGNYSALLGVVSNNTAITNLTIKDSIINATDDVDGEYYAAAFVAKAFNISNHYTLTLTGCSVENVTLGSCKYVGGLVAFQSGIVLTVNGCTISGCTINSNYFEGDVYKGHAGGVVGAMHNGIIKNTTVANTTMEVEGPRGGVMVGSILDNAVTITACYVSNVIFNEVEATSTDLVGSVDYRTDKTNGVTIY